MMMMTMGGLVSGLVRSGGKGWEYVAYAARAGPWVAKMETVTI